eukprot:gene11666-34380_t
MSTPTVPVATAQPEPALADATNTTAPCKRSSGTEPRVEGTTEVTDVEQQ